MWVAAVKFQQGGLGKPRVDIDGSTRQLSRIEVLVGACGRVQMICGTRESSVAQTDCFGSGVAQQELVEVGSK